MRIRMLRTVLVAPDGFKVERWREGEEHTIGLEHAQSLIRGDANGPMAVRLEGADEEKVVEPSEPGPAATRRKRR